MSSDPPLWTVAGMDADTPVVLLRDVRLHDRHAVLLFSDEERLVLYRVIELARARGDVMRLRDDRRRLTDHWVVRTGGVIAIGVGILDAIANTVVILHGGHF